MRKNKAPKNKQPKMKAHKEKAESTSSAKNYIVYFIIAFFMVFLTSSFVIEGVYNNADRILTTPEGVKEIYEVSIGMSSFEKIIEEYNNPTTTGDNQAAEPSAAPSPSATAAPTANQPSAQPTAAPAQ